MHSRILQAGLERSKHTGLEASMKNKKSKERPFYVYNLIQKKGNEERREVKKVRAEKKR